MVLKGKVAMTKKVKWITFSLYKNCFNDGEKHHLGFKYNGEYYCLTHSLNSVHVPGTFLRMKDRYDATKPAYLVKAKSKPEVIHVTNMRIFRNFLVNNLKNIK